MVPHSNRRLMYLLVFAAMLAAAYGTLHYYGIHGIQDYVDYKAACRHQLGRRLWFGAIEAGDDVAPLFAEVSPVAIQQHQHWTWATYLASDDLGDRSLLVLTARNGKLIDAYLQETAITRSLIGMTTTEREEQDRIAMNPTPPRRTYQIICEDINP